MAYIWDWTQTAIVGWPKVGPTWELLSRRGPYVSPNYIPVWGTCSLTSVSANATPTVIITSIFGWLVGNRGWTVVQCIKQWRTAVPVRALSIWFLKFYIAINTLKHEQMADTFWHFHRMYFVQRTLICFDSNFTLFFLWEHSIIDHRLISDKPLPETIWPRPLTLISNGFIVLKIFSLIKRHNLNWTTRSREKTWHFGG